VRYPAHKYCGKSHHKFLAHRLLFNDHGILHRDISLNNLLLYQPKTNESPADGLLMDFDNSEELDLIEQKDATTMEEFGTNEIVMADEDEAVPGPSEIFETENIRTVCSYFINCP